MTKELNARLLDEWSTSKMVDEARRRDYRFRLVEQQGKNHALVIEVHHRDDAMGERVWKEIVTVYPDARLTTEEPDCIVALTCRLVELLKLLREQIGGNIR